MRWGRLLLVGVSILSMTVSARASSLTPATRDGALPMRGENSLTNAFPCIGRQIDKSSRGPILITFQHFDDGSVPLNQNGPLNDRGPLSALFHASRPLSESGR